MDVINRYWRGLIGALRKWAHVGCGVLLVLHAMIDPNAYLIITTALYIGMIFGGRFPQHSAFHYFMFLLLLGLFFVGSQYDRLIDGGRSYAVFAAALTVCCANTFNPKDWKWVGSVRRPDGQAPDRAKGRL